MRNHQIWAEDPSFNQIQLSYLKWLRFISYISNELSVSPLQLQCLKVPRCPRTRRKLRKQLVTGSTRRFPFLISLEEYRLNIAAWLNNPQLLFMKIQGMRQARNLAPLSPDCRDQAALQWLRVSFIRPGTSNSLRWKARQIRLLMRWAWSCGVSELLHN